jgi:hypothetical protein
VTHGVNFDTVVACMHERSYFVSLVFQNEESPMLFESACNNYL